MVGPSRLEEEVSPLIAAAQEFALYLAPPKGVESSPTPALASRSVPTMPPIRPAAPSAKFTLRGTSVYPNQPGRSMALISEVGSLDGNERWVKEGTQVGHLVIHEIRQGAIIYRDGDQLREMTVDVVSRSERPRPGYPARLSYGQCGDRGGGHCAAEFNRPKQRHPRRELKDMRDETARGRRGTRSEQIVTKMDH